MKRIMNSAGFVPALVLSLFISSFVSAASVLDIGTEYRLRGISMSRVDYGRVPDKNYSYFSQRALAHVGGRFSPNIEIMTQIQALGVAGSSASVTDVSANPAGSRYPNTDFTPWMQWAYLKASQLYDWPVDVTVGRQPITIGDGLLFSDDDLGVTGIRMQSRLPIYGLRTDAFWVKAADSLRGNADTDVYAVQILKPTRNIRYSFMYLAERDATGNTNYIRPSENTEDLTLYPVGTDFRASKIERAFYNARVEARLAEGGFIKAEAALQTGRVSRSSATLGNTDLGGYAFLVSGGLFTRFSKYGPIEVHGSFGLASGDDGKPGKDKAFRPSFGHKFDGLERSGYGEYYGATLYDAIPSTSNPSGLPPGFSGIRVIGAGVTAHPTALLSVGIDYYVYTAQESAVAQFPISSSDTSLGTEIDIGVGFAYTSYLSFRGSAAFFTPGKAYANRDKASRFLIEAIGRF